MYFQTPPEISQPLTEAEFEEQMAMMPHGALMPDGHFMPNGPHMINEALMPNGHLMPNGPEDHFHFH